MDQFTPEKRSEIMRRVHSVDTTPEKAVRTTLHALGFRFRLHRKNLPGKPDIVLPKHHTVIFVHGCFWHRHAGCPRTTIPATHQEYWLAKFERTKARDQQNQTSLRSIGWRVEIIWECETKNNHLLENRLRDFLEGSILLYPVEEIGIGTRAAEKEEVY